MKCVFALTFLLMTSVAMTAQPDSDLILSGLSIVDVETGEVAAGQTVTIRDGIIQSIEPDNAISRAQDPNAVVHDFSGRFAIPGLWDMHVHIRGGPELAEGNRLWLQQYPGYGVTTVREAGGDMPDTVRSWREAIAKGAMPGPRILASRRKVDGAPGVRRGSVEIASQQDIPGALKALQSEGADFIKVNDGRYPDQTFLEILRQASALGLPTAAHVPYTVEINELAKAGLGSIEHAYFLTRLASADAEHLVEKFTNAAPGDDPFADYFGMYNDFALNIDNEKAAKAFEVMRQSGIAVTPTLYLLRRWFTVSGDTSADDDRPYAETPASILRTHDTTGFIEYMNERSPQRRTADVYMVSEAQRLVGLAAEQGVTILAGSDTGTTNTFVYPGDSLHHELAELVRAGMSPLQALRAASIDAAEWFNLHHEAGSIKAGKWADIVILSKNPVNEIRNTRTIEAVVQFGRLYDLESLRRLRTLAAGDVDRLPYTLAGAAVRIDGKFVVPGSTPWPTKITANPAFTPKCWSACPP